MDQIRVAQFTHDAQADLRALHIVEVANMLIAKKTFCFYLLGPFCEVVLRILCEQVLTQGIPVEWCHGLLPRESLLNGVMGSYPGNPC